MGRRLRKEWKEQSRSVVLAFCPSRLLPETEASRPEPLVLPGITSCTATSEPQKQDHPSRPEPYALPIRKHSRLLAWTDLGCMAGPQVPRRTDPSPAGVNAQFLPSIAGIQPSQLTHSSILTTKLPQQAPESQPYNPEERVHRSRTRPSTSERPWSRVSQRTSSTGQPRDSSQESRCGNPAAPCTCAVGNVWRAIVLLVILFRVSRCRRAAGLGGPDSTDVSIQTAIRTAPWSRTPISQSRRGALRRSHRGLVPFPSLSPRTCYKKN